MREAAAMWRSVSDAVGTAARDSLWDYPDLMPTSDDIDDPAALIARLEARARGEEPATDEMDDALARLLADAQSGDEASPGPTAEGTTPGDDAAPGDESDGDESDGDAHGPARPV
jgi:hypothetical protein